MPPIAPVSHPSPWRDLGRLYLFFLYFSVFHQLLVMLSGTAGSTGLRQAFYVSALWLIPPLLWPHCTRVYSAIVGLILWAASLVSLGYFAIYGQDFSSSVVFIIFESNPAEGSEFFQQYFKLCMLPALVAYSVVPLWLWLRLSPPQFSLQAISSLSMGIVAFVAVLPLGKPDAAGHSWYEGVVNLENHLEPAAPWQLVMGYVKYRQQLATMNRLLEVGRRAEPVSNLKMANVNSDSTVVLVIGESTNARRMGIYGYSRDTTPRLNEMKGEIAIFKNVFSPRPYTIESLQQVLTFADQQNPDAYLTGTNILKIMKQAGYKTYWITNQQTLTRRNTLLTTFSKQADEQVYLNNNRMQNSSQYDEVVLAPFEEVLRAKEKRKFVVVHLLGTHMKYHFRYPDSWNYFTDDAGIPSWVTDSGEKEVYNNYDSAIRYNDYVVSALIDKLKARSQPGFLVYLSDHGEEVYDHQEKHFVGRNEAAPTAEMYSIPFVVWLSPHSPTVAVADLEPYTARPYSTADFLYTWVDLCGITFDEWDPQRSVVNKHFAEKPVWVGNPYTPATLRDARALGWIAPDAALQLGSNPIPTQRGQN